MKKLRAMSLLIVCSMFAGVVAAAAPAGAEVPGKPFTSTQCEEYTDSVARLYTAGLGREPEQGGFDFWVTEYTLGNWTFPAMADFFVNSPEFAESYGDLDQDGFIRQLYRNVLGREGEAGGVAFWNQQMDAGMSRATVLMRFAESPENIANSGTVEPALGPFNEGRLPGPWRCGPDMQDALIQLSDLETGWVQLESVGSAPVVVDDCSSALRMPVDNDGNSFSRAPSAFLATVLYIAPTQHGADRYIDQVEEALQTCSSFVLADGTQVTYSPLSFTQYGDETIALRIVSTSPAFNDAVFVSDVVVVRVGSVIGGVQHTDAFSVSSTATEQYVELLATRMQSIPQG